MAEYSCDLVNNGLPNSARHTTWWCVWPSNNYSLVQTCCVVFWTCQLTRKCFAAVFPCAGYDDVKTAPATLACAVLFRCGRYFLGHGCWLHFLHVSCPAYACIGIRACMGRLHPMHTCGHCMHASSVCSSEFRLHSHVVVLCMHAYIWAHVCANSQFVFMHILILQTALCMSTRQRTSRPCMLARAQHAS